MTRILATISCIALATYSLALANTDISFDDVPENIMETALNTAPGVTFDRVSIEVENGVTIYEFEATDHNGRHIEIDVDENGRLEEIEMETDLDDVPSVVLATLEKTAPGFSISYIELSVRDASPHYVYEFDGSHDGRDVTIEIAEDGDLLITSQDLSS